VILVASPDLIVKNGLWSRRTEEQYTQNTHRSNLGYNATIQLKGFAVDARASADLDMNC
jgi:hypothetical protein